MSASPLSEPQPRRSNTLSSTSGSVSSTGRHSWWSDRNPGGATINLHTLAKPLIRAMYGREVAKLLASHEHTALRLDTIKIFTRYLESPLVGAKTKANILDYVGLRYRSPVDGEEEAVIDDWFRNGPSVSGDALRGVLNVEDWSQSKPTPTRMQATIFFTGDLPLPFRTTSSKKKFKLVRDSFDAMLESRANSVKLEEVTTMMHESMFSSNWMKRMKSKFSGSVASGSVKFHRGASGLYAWGRIIFKLPGPGNRSVLEVTAFWFGTQVATRDMHHTRELSGVLSFTARMKVHTK